MTQRSGVRDVLLKTAFLGAILLGGCVAQTGGSLDQVNPGAGFSQVSKAYPDMDARYVRVGAPRTISEVRRISVGQSRSDLQAVLGRPAVQNGDGSYEFHLSLPLTGRDRLICQYRVFFDGEGKVSRAVWRRQQCADLVARRRG